MQVYRYLDIGSGKPAPEERDAVKHHLIDIVDPDYRFTAGDFCREAGGASRDIRSSGKIPLFVGGTGLYIDSFFLGLSEIPAIDQGIKEQLLAEFREQGLDSLYRELQICDNAFAARIHSNDRQRILRGLEVYRGTGRSLSSYFDEKKSHESERTLYLGLRMEKEELHKRIDLRVMKMIASGFLEEVTRLRAMGFTPNLNSMRSIGYAELNDYLDGRTGWEEAIDKIRTETKRYAKRQMTWFRKSKKIHWFGCNEMDAINDLVNRWRENASGK